MKRIFKLSGTLLFNQFIADIAGGMCVISLPFMFGQTMFTYILNLSLLVFFFYYISYNGAYKDGFHDIGKHSSDRYDNGFVRRGLLASFIAASPSIIMFLLWLIGKKFGIPALYALQFPLSLWSWFSFWPLQHIFPNHLASCYLITIAMQLIFPVIGYCCGYKGIVFKDQFLKLLGMNKKR